MPSSLRFGREDARILGLTHHFVNFAHSEHTVPTVPVDPCRLHDVTCPH